MYRERREIRDYQETLDIRENEDHLAKQYVFLQTHQCTHIHVYSMLSTSLHLHRLKSMLEEE